MQASDPGLETVKLIFDAVKVMIPVLTGFLVVFVGAVGKLWDMSRKPPGSEDIRISWVTAGLVVVVGVWGLGFWAGAMEFGIKYVVGGPQSFWLVFQDIPTPKLLWLARQFNKWGYRLFIVSVSLAGVFCYMIVRPRHRDTATAKNVG